MGTIAEAQGAYCRHSTQTRAAAFLKGILRSAVQPPPPTPVLAAGTGTSADGSAMWPEARGDVLMALPPGISITNISVIHPSLRIPSPGRLPQLEQRHLIGISRRRLGMHEWSRMATASYPSLWRHTIA
jgi:hypothetical protein